MGDIECTRKIVALLNKYRVQPAKCHAVFDSALEQLDTFIGMKISERDEEEKKRVEAQNRRDQLLQELKSENKGLNEE